MSKLNPVHVVRTRALILTQKWPNRAKIEMLHGAPKKPTQKWLNRAKIEVLHGTPKNSKVNL